MWRYVYLVIYLRRKDPMTLSGIETAIMQAIADPVSPSFAWLDFHSAGVASDSAHAVSAADVKSVLSSIANMTEELSKYHVRTVSAHTTGVELNVVRASERSLAAANIYSYL